MKSKIMPKIIAELKRDRFWWEAMKILLLGFVFETLAALLIGIPNLLFYCDEITFFAWVLPVIWLIVVLFATGIIVKGLWLKLKEAFKE